MIEYGDADVMAAGGAEHCFTGCIGGFAASGAHSSTRNDDPPRLLRPWTRGSKRLCWRKVLVKRSRGEYDTLAPVALVIHVELVGFA